MYIYALLHITLRTVKFSFLFKSLLFMAVLADCDSSLFLIEMHNAHLLQIFTSFYPWQLQLNLNFEISILLQCDIFWWHLTYSPCCHPSPLVRPPAFLPVSALGVLVSKNISAFTWGGTQPARTNRAPAHDGSARRRARSGGSPMSPAPQRFGTATSAIHSLCATHSVIPPWP